MANKTLIAALLATAGDSRLPKKARIEAFQGIEAHFEESKKRLPESIAALGATLVTQRERGVCDYIRELVMDDSLSWGDIVLMCQDKFPGCKTSTKSVASIARDMRKDGVDVPHRTKKGTPKIGGDFADAIESLDDMEFEDAETAGDEKEEEVTA
jgi:hypothetical protein